MDFYYAINLLKIHWNWWNIGLFGVNETDRLWVEHSIEYPFGVRDPKLCIPASYYKVRTDVKMLKTYKIKHLWLTLY